MSNISKSLVVLFLMLSFVGTAQNDKKLIKRGFSAYLQAIIDQEYDKSMDYILEEVFDIVPRDEMISTIAAVTKIKQMDFKFGEFSIERIKRPISIDAKQYAILDYVSNMSIKFNKLESQEEQTKEDVKMRNNMIFSSLEGTYGKGNVRLNNETDFFDIKAIKKAVAIKNKDASSWKFIVVEKGQPSLMKQILPAEILEKVLPED